MSQSYFSPRRQAQSEQSTPALVETPAVNCEKQLHDVQAAYIEHKNRLVNAIDSTKTILGDLRSFNKNSWVVRYPQFHDNTQEEPSAHRRALSRTLSFADDPSARTDIVLKPARKGLARAVTLATIKDAEEEQSEHPSTTTETEDDAEHLIPSTNASDFHVFRLDLKLGAHGSSNSPASLVSQLGKNSIASLLDERIAGSMSHIDKLRVRVEDTSSKVLVTGDLNAGKSTFVNALLRRDVMPVDQQPCTTAFCEVHDAKENEGKEEVHIISPGASYDIKDGSSYVRAELSDLENFISENENSDQILKLYLNDPRSPTQSLLNNGIADISLIDAPGLNRDSFKTTSLFARQEEIDVIVFVVSAENHFTLSAREFLFNASNEKAYVFIVVNKYEQIRDKNKCKRLVLEQIKQLSPRTYENADELVHFVDSASVMGSEKENKPFENLESALRSFVITKRSKSKLNPASTYLAHILSDVDLLAGASAIVAQSELDRAREDLKRERPVLEKMKNGRDVLEEALETVEEDSSRSASSRTSQILTDALDKVGSGFLAVEKTVQLPSYPGLLGIWDYARDVRKALLASLDAAVGLAEDEARIITTSGVQKIAQLGDEHMPEGVETERVRRVFRPEAMFSAGRDARRKSRRISSSSSGAVVAGGTAGLGIGLAQRADLLEPTFFDIFDVQHQWIIHFGDKKTGEEDEDEETSPTALGVVSVGLGALTMVGGQALGMRSIVEGVVRLSDLMGNDTARKWAAPVVGATVIGLTAYFILELPSTIPRTVGRRIKRSLVKKDGVVSEDMMFVGAHAGRVSRETRKVLRLASWSEKERFRSVMEERASEVRKAEEMERRAVGAVEWFEEVGRRTGDVRDRAGLVSSNV